MGRAGRAAAERGFAIDACTAEFCRTLEQVYG
jgi:hypothetical protein